MFLDVSWHRCAKDANRQLHFTAIILSVFAVFLLFLKRDEAGQYFKGLSLKRASSDERLEWQKNLFRHQRKDQVRTEPERHR